MLWVKVKLHLKTPVKSHVLTRPRFVVGEPGLSHGSSSHASVVSRVFGSGTGTREWMLAVLVVQADLGGGAHFS